MRMSVHGETEADARADSSKSVWQLQTFRRKLLAGLWAIRVPLAMLLSGVLLQSLAAFAPHLTERFYGRTAYPLILTALSSFSRRFSFSVGEVFFYILLTVVLLCVVRFCVLLLFNPEGWLRRIGASTRFIIWGAAVLLWSFLLVFGLNYQRPPLYDLLGFERRRASARELEALGGEVVDRVNQNYLEAHAEGRPTPSREDVVAFLNESFKSSQDLTLLPKGEYAAPKPVYLSGVLTRLGISGVYSPFTSEPNFNAEAPDFQLPFSIAHEMAHQRGVARESEANFVAYLVCVNSRDPFIRYSGYRHGLGVLSELYRLEPEKARELVKRLDPGYSEDSRRAALFWAKAAGRAGALSYRVNDLYLRANRIRSGADDYSGSTALIIGRYLRETSRTNSPHER